MSVLQAPDLDQALQRCIDNCTECQAICEQMEAHGLGLGDENGGKKVQDLLQDCAQLCAVNVDFMKRGSDLHPFTALACAEACCRCAEECERIAEGDARITECAEVCRRSEVSCRAMSIKVQQEMAAITSPSKYSPPRPEEE